MNTAEQWYATRNFQGLDTNGKPRNYKRGDTVPGVEKWPTFKSLMNIEWIAAKPVGDGNNSRKPPELKVAEKVAPIVKEKKKAAKAAKKKTTKATKKAAPKATVAAQEHSCKECGKTFATSRALNVHVRYH